MFSLIVPRAAKRTSRSRTPLYISAATQSITVNVTLQGSSTSLQGYPITADLTPTSSGCSSTLAGTLCTLSLNLPGGNYDATMTTYDGANGTGNVLSAAQSVPFTVVTGASNPITLTLGGIPVSAQIVVTSPTTMPGDASNGFTLAKGQTGSITVIGVDADGNFILGAGAPSVTLTSNDDTEYTATPAGAGSPNRFAVANVSNYPAVAILTATITPSAQSGGSPLSTTARVFSQAATLYIEESSSNLVAGYSQFGTQTVSGFTSSSNPAAAAYDPVNGLLYVVNAGNNTISVFTPSGAVQVLASGSFPNLDEPEGIVYDSATGFLYIANEGNSTVTVYNATGAQQTGLSGTFPGLDAPHGIAYDPVNGFIYVTNVSGDDITVYDGNGNQQTTSGSFGGLDDPDGIAYDTANGDFYVTNFLNGAITEYDPNGAQIPLGGGSVTGPPHPTGITYDEANGLLYEVDPSTGGVIAYTDSGADGARRDVRRRKSSARDCRDPVSRPEDGRETACGGRRRQRHSSG